MKDTVLFLKFLYQCEIAEHRLLCSEIELGSLFLWNMKIKLMISIVNLRKT